MDFGSVETQFQGSIQLESEGNLLPLPPSGKL